MDTFTDDEGLNLRVHTKEQCEGGKENGCPIHAPSDHGLRKLPLFFNSDEQMFHRRLPDGSSTPDPDSMAFLVAHRNAVRCLICNDEIESTHRHNFVTCRCGNVSVDGGPAYKRRAFKTNQFVEL